MSNNTQPILEFLQNKDFAKAIAGYEGWGRFQAILMYIGAAFLILVTIFYWIVAIVAMGAAKATGEEGSAIGIGILIFIYTIFMVFAAIFYFLMGRKLWKSTTKVKNLKKSASVEEYVRESAANISLMRSFFKLQGILTIGSIVFSIIFMIIYIVFVVTVIVPSSYEDRTYNYDNEYYYPEEYEDYSGNNVYQDHI